jgi:hypothetical protein
LLFGAFAALVGAALIGDNEERCLQEKLDGLIKKPAFNDANGVELVWPYAVTPVNMTGLRDVCPPPRGLHDEAHAFVLAENGSVDVQCRARGFGKRGLELTLANLGGESLDVDLPAGSVFVARNCGGRTQPLITQEDLRVALSPGEKRTLPLDVYCGDSGGSVPRCCMALSQYVVEREHLGSQRTVWQWSARFQPVSGSAASPAREDFETLQESFGMSRREVQSMLHEFDAIAKRSATAREQEVVNVRHQITEARRRRSSHSSSSASGGSGFGGGRSSGGGAGCSW